MGKFDAKDIILEGSNLIEASAGTGKTFSIATMVLRLIVSSKNITIDQILLVTFTDAAAAELKERAAKFIRLAKKEVAESGSANEKTIELIIKKELESQSPQNVLDKLNAALLDIDKGAMQTIHSFCQRTLTEFAFETGQIYGVELITDFSAILKLEVDKYWREKLSIEDLIKLNSPGYNYKTFYKAVELAIGNQDILPTKSYVYANLEVDLETAINEIKKNVHQKLSSRNHITYDDLIKNLYAVRKNVKLQKLLRSKYKAVFIDEFQDTDKLQYELFYELFQNSKKGDPQSIIFYIGDPKQSIYGWRKADLKTYAVAKKVVDNGDWTMNINYRSTPAYIKSMNQFFKPHGNFDPFSLDSKNKSEIEYHDVEVSEANKAKYGLKTANGSLLKPMILEIKNSKNDIDSALIYRIRYLLSGEVKLFDSIVKCNDIGILVRSNKAGRKIKELLEKEKIPAVVLDDSNIFKTEEASDLLELLNAILETTQSNIDRALITTTVGQKTELILRNDYDELVFQFKEYRKVWEEEGVYMMLKQLFEYLGVFEKWIKNTTTGHRILSNHTQLAEMLQKKSISQSYNPTELYKYLLIQNQSEEKSEEKENAQRIESDEQAVKIVTIHKSKGLEYPIVIMPELVLKNKPEHYRLFFSIRTANSYGFVKYHNGGDVGNNVKYPEYNALAVKQNEEENRRLIYVAITRAKFNAFVITTELPYNKDGTKRDERSWGSIHDYIESLKNRNCLDAFTEDESLLKIQNNKPKNEDEALVEIKMLEFPKRDFIDKNWHKLSYSFLAAKHSSSSKPDENNHKEGTYDHFVFKTLPRGIKIGNLLHNILEFADFCSDKDWDDLISNSVNRFTPSKKEDQVFKDFLKEMLRHIVEAKLGEDNPVYLKDVARLKRINELEFNFPLDNVFNMSGLEYILPESDLRIIKSKNKGEVMGIMNGLMDMFFEYNGKYYILDWKSNFLGDSLDNYNPTELNDAMNESNYHLQYLLYTLAAKNFLNSRLPDFNYEQHFGGVIYLFLRGVREGSDSGVFTAKPSLDEINRLDSILSGK